MYSEKRLCVAILSMALAAGMPCTAVGESHNRANEKTETTGIITGRVVDSDHHALPGATVTIKGIKGVFTSDANGNFKLPKSNCLFYKHLIFMYFCPIINF